MMDQNEQSAVETVTEKAGEAASAVGSGAKKVVSAVAENPALAAAGAAAVGAAVGGTALAKEKKRKASASSKKRQPAKKTSAKHHSTLSCEEVRREEVDHWNVEGEEVVDARGRFEVEGPQAHGQVHCQEVNGQEVNGQENVFFEAIVTA